jgi:hypothetical protein
LWPSEHSDDDGQHEPHPRENPRRSRSHVPYPRGSRGHPLTRRCTPPTERAPPTAEAARRRHDAPERNAGFVRVHGQRELVGGRKRNRAGSPLTGHHDAPELCGPAWADRARVDWPLRLIASLRSKPGEGSTAGQTAGDTVGSSLLRAQVRVLWDRSGSPVGR